MKYVFIVGCLVVGGLVFFSLRGQTSTAPIALAPPAYMDVVNPRKAAEDIFNKRIEDDKNAAARSVKKVIKWATDLF